MLLVSIFLLFFCSAVGREVIDWKNYVDGVLEVKTEGKPGILMLYNPHCPACQHLDNIFKESESIQLMAQKFVMIRSSDGSVSSRPEFKGGKMAICVLIILRWLVYPSHLLSIPGR